MSDIPISSLPVAVSLDGSETVPIVQGGTTKRVATSLLWSSNPATLPVGGLTGQALVKTGTSNYQVGWETTPGLGTVQEIDTGIGLTGGPITLIGTVSLASIATGNVLANVSGISAAPTPQTPSAVLDVIGSTRGDILYRGASGWSALPPGSTGQILTTGGAGADPAWSAVGSGTVQSVGLALPGIFTVSGSPVTTTGTLTGTLATQSANLVWAGPSTGAASAPTFRSLVGADLPNPAPTTLGGVKSLAAVSHQFLTQIGTDGSVSQAQPAFSDISGTLALSQLGTQSANTVLSGPTSGGASNPTFRSLVGADLPNPSAVTLGGVQSLAAVTSKWINQISTSGVPSATQPDFSDLTGSIAISQLPAISNNTVLANTSGGSTQPTATSPSAVLDIIGSTQGTILYRGASSWSALAVGTDGQVLTTHGAAANPTWTTVTGTGTVTSVATGTGLTGGPVTTTGTISLASIANGTVLANTSGISAAPSATTPTSILDVIGSTQGSVLYRGASNWSALAPGTSGQFLQTLGAGSTPQWAAAVTVVSGGTGITVTGTTTPTVALSAARQTLPTRQSFTSGSGTYTTPANCLYIRVRMVGAGGGGGGGGIASSSGGNAGAGGNTTFGSYTAHGGGGGAGAASGTTPVGGAGGSGGSGSGALVWPGVNGEGVVSLSVNANNTGGLGGNSVLFGGGAMPNFNGANAGLAATGGGGSGGSAAGTTAAPGGGGGGGESFDILINGPASSYSYSVGSGGSAGAAGTSGSIGAIGGSGVIVVDEFYN